eukprot:SAG31_NODE_9_length_42330_cov_441.979162_21_plen_282_part_00
MPRCMASVVILISFELLLCTTTLEPMKHSQARQQSKELALCVTIVVVFTSAQSVMSGVTELGTWLGGRRCTFAKLSARPTVRGEQVLSGRAAERPGFRAGAAAGWSAVGRWTRAALSELLANRTVPMLRGGASGFLFAPKADKAQSTGKLADVFQSSSAVTHQPTNNSAYIFSEVSAPAWGHRASLLAPLLLGCMPNPPHAIGDVPAEAQRLFFAVGSAGSGLGFHAHPAAWNVVLHGSKWVNQDSNLEALRPFSCTCRGWLAELVSVFARAALRCEADVW